MENVQALRSLRDHANEAMLALDAGRHEDIRVQLREIQYVLRHIAPSRLPLSRCTDRPTAKGM